MADYTVTDGFSSFYPSRHYGGHFVGDRASFCERDDLSVPTANILSIPNTPVNRIGDGQIIVSPMFFASHIRFRDNDGFSDIAYHSVRSHDLANGASRWQFIEPSDSTSDESVWNFTELDEWVNSHSIQRKELLFTLYGTPQWASARPDEKNAYSDHAPEPFPYNRGIAAEPANMAHWDRYCAKIATRYKGKIKYYEVWNEPNYQNNGTTVTGERQFFSGTFAKLAEMTRRANQVIKAIDPNAKIISSPITDWNSTPAVGDTTKAEGYFTGMMSASTGDGSTTMKDWVDIVGVHLYIPSTEGGIYVKKLSNMIDRINAAKTAAGVSSLDTWDTESAPIASLAVNMSDASINRYLSRFYLTCAAKGIKRSFYYMVDLPTMGFLNRTSVYMRFNDIRTLLTQGRITNGLSRLSDGRVAYWIDSELVII